MTFGGSGSGAQGPTLVLSRAGPFLPDGSVGQHFDEHAADDRAGVHAVAMDIVGDVGIHERRARGGVVQVIVDRAK